MSNSMCQVAFADFGAVESAARQEPGLDRIVARGPRFRGRRRHARAFGDDRRGRRARGDFGGDPFERARGFLAAPRAQRQPLFLLEEQSIGVVGAHLVAALSAVLLRHRRHHAQRRRLVLSHRHALADRQRRVVPRRGIVVGELSIIDFARRRRRVLDRRIGAVRLAGLDILRIVEGAEAIARRQEVDAEADGVGQNDCVGRDRRGHRDLPHRRRQAEIEFRELVDPIRQAATAGRRH